jgi:uncharacterized LabA/DUF88 family protein
MINKPNNYAFIDGQNLYLSLKSLGWTLDYCRFRIYLRDKYAVAKAYLFIGYIKNNDELYQALREAGFICIFKPILEYQNGAVKGNCDAELVLQAMIEYQNYQQAVIITGDGDFYCLVNYLLSQGKLKAVIVPNKFKFSALLKFKIFRPYLRYLNDLELKLGYKKKRPYKDETS